MKQLKVLELFDEQSLWNEDLLSLDKLLEFLNEINELEGNIEKIISIIFTDDLSMRALNSDFRNKDKTTDVLSFPMEDEEYLGEIYISIPQVLRQAPRFDASPGDELRRVSLHGLLHIFGYDHIKPSERKIMRSKEETYLNTSIY
jgi:probable rRNA maturation factor